MEFKDLKRQYLSIKPEIDRQISEVIDSSAFILSDKVKSLEEELANYVGRKYVVAVGNGTDALELSLIALGIKEGDAVFVPDFTYIASASVIERVHAHPVFVDIDKNTFNISIKDLRERIQEVLIEGKYTPKAIIAVDLFGLCADYKEISQVANEFGLLVIEDAAQGFGAKIKEKRACSFGDISITSFFPAKPLGCYGDGGAIFVDDYKTYELLKSLRSNGQSPLDKYDNVIIGMNSRLDSIQAAILLAKLKVFDEELIRINRIADKYSSSLKEIVVTPKIPETYTSSWAQYTVLFKDNKQRADVISKLKVKGIPSMVYYPKALHEQKCFAHMEIKQYPVTDYIKERCLSLPIFPYMNDEEVNEVIKAIKEIVNV